jgi:hypothetical protein
MMVTDRLLSDQADTPPDLEPEPDIRNLPGCPGFFELRTPHPEEAARFLTELFGWEVRPTMVAGVDYLEATLRGHSIGGIRQPGPGEPETPHWVTYVTAASVGEIAEGAVAAGGQVLMPPMSLGEEGRLTVVAHPAAGQLFAFQYSQPLS